MNHTVVIVGAGQAGLQTAFSLRQSGFVGQVVLLGNEAYLPYQRPPLSKQLLKGEFDVERCALRQKEFLDNTDIDFRPSSHVTGLDSKKLQVTLEDGQVLTCNDLVIATGASVNRPDLEGSHLENVHYLRTIDDTLSLRTQLREGGHLVIAGGGYIGLEVAASARALGCKVSVVEAEDHIMKRSALPPVADFLLAQHRNAGVHFHLGRRMTRIHGVETVQGVSLDDGTLIEADTVLNGLGVHPELGWLEGSGIATRRGVLVDDCCRTNRANVYAAGDCAETAHPMYTAAVVLESVQNAVTQGKICAASILDKAIGYKEVPWFWSEQYDYRLQMAGLPQPLDTLVIRHTEPDSLSALSLGADRLNAIQCINTPRDYMAARKLIAAGTSVDMKRLLDPNLQLKDIL